MHDYTITGKRYRESIGSIKLDVKALGNNFLFLGNTYLTKGITTAVFFKSELWKAYFDGKKMEIYKTHHDFIGIVVPKGPHKVEFVFTPTSFKESEYLVPSFS